MKSVLIVASTGFIGKSLVEHFKEDLRYDITAVNSKDLDMTCESEVNDFFLKHFYDVVINCSHYGTSRGGRVAEKELENNLRIFLNLEKNSSRYGKLLYLGSGAEYDKRQSISMVREEEVGRSIPTDQYGIYKYTVDRLIRQSSNIYNLKLFGIFGKYEDWKIKLITGMCCKAVKGLPLTIRQNVYFDYLWMGDFARIIEWFIQNEPKHRTYNVATGQKIDLLTIAALVKKVSKKDLPIYVCREGLGREYTANNERLLAEMGGFEFTAMQDCIEELYRWFLKMEDEISIYPLLYQ